jgi:hypothetical protein
VRGFAGDARSAHPGASHPPCFTTPRRERTRRVESAIATNGGASVKPAPGETPLASALIHFAPGFLGESQSEDEQKLLSAGRNFPAETGRGNVLSTPKVFCRSLHRHSPNPSLELENAGKITQRPALANVCVLFCTLFSHSSGDRCLDARLS